MTQWDRSTDPEVQKIVSIRARQIAWDFDHAIEAADLEQEAMILIATKPEFDTDDYGLIDHRIRADMINLCTTRQSQRRRNVPLMSEQDEPSEPAVEYVPLSPVPGGYTREQIELLLPAVWDESYCYGLPAREDAPDPDMPRGSVNVAHGNNLSAYIADVKSGWKKAPLTLLEKRAVVLRFGAAYMDREIAEHEGVDRSTITHRIETAVTKIANYLNGEE